MRGKPYTEEFRKNIVRLHLEENRTLKSLGTEYGVSVSTVSRWVIYQKNKSIRDVKTEQQNKNKGGVKNEDKARFCNKLQL